MSVSRVLLRGLGRFLLLAAVAWCPSLPGFTSAQDVASESEIVQWKIPWPNLDAEAGGYPVLATVKHYEVFRAPNESRRYHHHPHITFADQQFLIMFSEHPIGEDGPGQRVLLSKSNDGVTWDDPIVLIPSLDEVRSPELKGRALCPNGWVILGRRTFAIGEVWDNVGFREIGKDVLHDKRTASAGQRVRKGLGRVAREVKSDGELGPLFWLHKNPPASAGPAIKILAGDHPEIADVATALTRRLALPVNPTSWDFQNPTRWPKGIDGHRLTEPTGVRLDDGLMVRFYRDLMMSHRVYASTSLDGGLTWTIPSPTDIPDSPSKSVAGLLPDGGMFLIGNFVSGPRSRANSKHIRRIPLVLALSDDGILFDRAFAIVHKPTRIRFDGPGKGQGFQYPDAVVVSNDLWVVYSINKEDIAVAKIPISALAKPARD